MQAQQENQNTPFWEKALGIVGILFLVFIVGFLLYQAIQPKTPPSIGVAFDNIETVEGGFLVHVEATNSGRSTAAMVEVEGTLKASDDAQAQPVESSSITFDYIPAQSKRVGGLFFYEDPSQYILEVQAKGYVEP